MACSGKDPGSGNRKVGVTKSSVQVSCVRLQLSMATEHTLTTQAEHQPEMWGKQQQFCVTLLPAKKFGFFKSQYLINSSF